MLPESLTFLNIKIIYSIEDLYIIISLMMHQGSLHSYMVVDI